MGAQEAGGSRDPDKLHVQREPSTAEVMEYGVKPGIKFWLSPLPAQGITNLTRHLMQRNVKPTYLGQFLSYEPRMRDGKTGWGGSSGFSEADHTELAMEPGLGAKFP